MASDLSVLSILALVEKLCTRAESLDPTAPSDLLQRQEETFLWHDNRLRSVLAAARRTGRSTDVGFVLTEMRLRGLPSPMKHDASVEQHGSHRVKIALQCLRWTFAVLLEDRTLVHPSEWVRFHDVLKRTTPALNGICRVKARDFLSGFPDHPPAPLASPSTTVVEFRIPWLPRASSSLAETVVPVPLKTVQSEDAPVVHMLPTPGDDMPVREWQGTFLRPLLVPGHWSHATLAEVVRAAGSGEPWADNPAMPPPRPGACVLSIDEITAPPRRSGRTDEERRRAAIMDASIRCGVLYLIEDKVHVATSAPTLRFAVLGDRMSLESEHTPWSRLARPGAGSSVLTAHWRLGRLAGTDDQETFRYLRDRRMHGEVGPDDAPVDIPYDEVEGVVMALDILRDALGRDNVVPMPETPLGMPGNPEALSSASAALLGARSRMPLPSWSMPKVGLPGHPDLRSIMDAARIDVAFALHQASERIARSRAQDDELLAELAI